MPDNFKISELEDYDSPPTDTTWFALAEDGTNSKINGYDLITPFSYRITDGSIIGIGLTANFQVIFDDTTDRNIPGSGAPTRGGWELIVASIQIPASGHKFVLPSGITFDGTNRAVVLDSATDVLVARSISATRYVIIYNNGCTFAAS